MANNSAYAYVEVLPKTATRQEASWQANNPYFCACHSARHGDPDIVGKQNHDTSLLSSFTVEGRFEVNCAEFIVVTHYIYSPCTAGTADLNRDQPIS